MQHYCYILATDVIIINGVLIFDLGIRRVYEPCVRQRRRSFLKEENTKGTWYDFS